MSLRAANAYRRVDLESAPKTMIVERLFDRFSLDLDTARAAIARKDVVGKASALDHALRIVVELQASLDHAASPELSANLHSLYGFVAEKIADCNLTQSPVSLDQAGRVMSELGDAFRQAHAQVK